MNSESRVVRPYSGVERFDHVFDEIALAVGSEEIENGGEKILPAAEYLSTPVEVVLAEDESELETMRFELREGAKELGIDPAAIHLVVLVYSPRLKRTEIVYTLPLVEIGALPARLPIASPSNRPDGFRAPFGGCRVELYVCLAEPQERQPLRPWRLGTWLGRARFKVSTDLGEFGFTPRIMTEELRNEFKLPAGTSRYITVDTPTVQGIEPDAVGLYVDEDLLGHLVEYKSGAAAEALQRQLFLEALSAIVLEAAREDDFEEKSFDDLDGSLCGQVVKLVAGIRPRDKATDKRQQLEAALNLLRDKPASFLAHLEAECNTKETWEEALKGDGE